MTLAPDAVSRAQDATETPDADAHTPVTTGRKRAAEPISNRVRRDGKFFRLGADKFIVKGVTYGSFKPGQDDQIPLPAPDQVLADIRLIKELGANTLRIYNTPPAWFCDLIHEHGLKLMLDVSWGKHFVFTQDRKVAQDARDRVRDAARACGNHPALFAISVANEIPPEIVRYIGAEKAGEFVDELVTIAKGEAPDCLITFANFPSTEYLQSREVDFVTFNVYLHDETAMRNYLCRLQHVAGERPLLLGEYGIDTSREKSEEEQASILERQFSAAFDEGIAGAFVFSFTDDWYVHGWQADWHFGLVRADRSKKPSFAAMKDVFARAPQTTRLKLPKVSVIICSYNGASTTESCLRSMRRIRYPDFEVVFVDDGSKDNTQEIVAMFPEVVNIRQKNMGLSYARNVGMEAATGEIIVYTDSDCEADEDWLYYLVLTMLRGNHIGCGGPNLIPDEGSWVADCVGLSPGGPTHVMINDREAEHVPGCNMGFWRWAALEVKGFDSQFRKAGDDVDFIWRLQNRGWSIGFAAAAQVWHYRRNSVEAYLRQQRGYGEAEALLKYKHPDHFNTLGAGLWRGRIYGADIGVRFGGDVIYHGVFGTGLFQTIYRRPASMLAMMLMSVEWHLLTLFVGVLGLAFAPLLYVALLMFLTPIALAITAAVQAMPAKIRSKWVRPLVAYLHWRQPIVRGLARYTVRLKHKNLGDKLVDYVPTRLPFNPDEPHELLYWSTWGEWSKDRITLLDSIKKEVEAAGLRYRIDAGWRDWDLEIYGSRYAKVRITTVSERHEGSGHLFRIRVDHQMTNFNRVILGAGTFLALFLLWTVWPFSRPAVLIPLAAFAMFVVNRSRVGPPVLGVIDTAATKAGFYQVWPKN